MSSLVTVLQVVFKGGQVLAAAGAATQIGEAVLARAGLIKPETRLIRAGMDAVLGAVIPRQAPEEVDAFEIGEATVATAPALPATPVVAPVTTTAPDIGNAPAVAAETTDGKDDNENEELLKGVETIYAGWADAIGMHEGEIRLCGTRPNLLDAKYTGGTKDKHHAYLQDLILYQKCVADHAAQSRIAGEAEELEVVKKVDALYEGWGDAMEVGEASLCGKKPKLTDVEFQAPLYKGSVVNKPRITLFFKKLADWQSCVQAEKEQQKQAEAAQKAAVTKAAKSAAKSSADRQKKVAEWALVQQQQKFNQELQALKDAAAAEKTAEEQAKIDARMQELLQAKQDAEKLALTLQTQAKDAQQQAMIDKLTAEISSKAKEPGGMDEMFKMIMMQRLMEPAAPQAPAAAPAMDPAYAMMTMQAQSQAEQLAALQNAQTMSAFGDPGAIPWEAQSGGDMYYYGDAEPLDEEIAEELGLEGARTNDEGRLLFELKNAGWSEDALQEFVGDHGDVNTSSCSTGSCGLR